MSTNARDGFIKARKCWPERGKEALIPAAARPVYDSWMSASSADRLEALAAALTEGLTRLPGKDTSRPSAGTSLCLGPLFPKRRAR